MATEMEIDSSSQELNVKGSDANGKKLNRNTKCGVRVIGNRIYDSANGKTCHQCRQKTRDFSAACKNPRTGKPCQIRFCHKCLLNRYGEKAEEVELLNDWMCPKCRGICNCSFCMKKRGEQPTGILVHSAKASGFNSVSAMLRKKASESLESNNAVVLPVKEATLEKELVVELFGEPGKLNSLGGNKGLKVENEKTKKVNRKKLQEPTPEKELVVDLSGEPVKQNSVGGNISLKVENGKTKTMKRKKLKEDTLEKELVVDLSGEPGKQNSVGENIGLKVENEKTKTVKKKKLKETTLGKELVGDISGEPGKQNSVGGNIGLKVKNEKTKTVKQKKLKEATLGKDRREYILQEVVLGLSSEPGKENSLGGVNASKVGREKTKKVKRENLKEISNGNSVDDACQNKKSKKPKLCNVVSEGEVKPKANADMGTRVGENHGDGDNAGAKSQTNGKVLHEEKIKEEIPFPLSTEMTKISDIEFAPEDVGNALQFLEFCKVFGKALDVKKGEAVAVLRALIRKQNLRRGQNTLVVEFQIKLLTLIVSDSETESSSLTASNGKNSWLKVLEDLTTESDAALKEFPADWLNKGISGYYDLDLSKKLILLNFICDEALSTMKLRNFIDDQNARFAEEKKAAKSKVSEAKEKERSLKQKLQDEIAKAVVSNGASLSISEHDALLAKIKSEATKAHTELIEAKGTIPKRNRHCDAVRIEPEYLDNIGKTFWKLRSCNDEYAFLLQDLKIHDEDGVEVDEKWFVYGAEQKDEVTKYISSRRHWLPKLTSTF